MRGTSDESQNVSFRTVLGDPSGAAMHGGGVTWTVANAPVVFAPVGRRVDRWSLASTANLCEPAKRFAAKLP